ncbi:C6 transcription factor [Penicillium sp. IBT 18751x]|nr:C6 transcription factor [Penicillium sp. IBT 18751x]
MAARPVIDGARSAMKLDHSYENEQALTIHEFNGGKKLALPIRSAARRRSLPVRQRLPGTVALAKDVPPKAIPDRDVDDYTLRSFLHEFCIVSTGSEVTHGFLSGMEPRLRKVNDRSNLAKACKMVALANHGIKLNRPDLIAEAEKLNHGLVSSLAVGLQNNSGVSKKDDALVVMLFGIYEMIIANDARSGFHNAHASGLAALLKLKNNPKSVLEALRNGQSLGILREGIQNAKMGLLAMPNVTASTESLDSLLIALVKMGGKVKITATDGLMDCDEKCWLLREALNLDQKFKQWSEAQSQRNRPTIIGQVSKTTALESSVGYWPGRVDVYFDRYIAGIWNIYRAARLYLSELILKLSNGNRNPRTDPRHGQDMDDLVQDVLSSIPYHLTENLYGFLNQIDSGAPLANVGQAASGLFVMHSLHVISNLSLVDLDVRCYLKRCLLWIGKNMGIGQASLFSKSSKFETEDFASVCMFTLTAVAV